MEYKNLNNLNDIEKTTFSSMFNGILNNIKSISSKKLSSIIKDIPSVCEMSYSSYENLQLAKNNSKFLHPIVPYRGEIYNAFITESVGTELCGTHPVLIIQNQNSNIHSCKVNVLPIEGDGKKINPKYHEQITNADFENNIKLIKNPSRVVISDVLTIDKSRLNIRIGKLKIEKMKIINNKIKNHLGL